MTFNEYQKQATRTAIYSDFNRITYPAMGVANEAGEVIGKVKKVIRDNDGVFLEEHKHAIAKEMGDVLWYLAALADDIGVPLAAIAQWNLDKLEDRANRGVIGGSGDDR